MTPAPAATLILLRENAGRLEVYLLRRSGASGFMAGNWVFPGGGVDPADRRPELYGPCLDLDPAALDRRFGGGLSAEEALAYAVAAVRETFEEAGVLFLDGRAAGPGGELARAAALRAERRLPRGWLAGLVAAGAVTLRLAALHPWSHWITPLNMPKRFDTRFFAALMPPGGTCLPDGREVTAGMWISPREALAENHAGRLPLSPPTVVTLHGMLALADTEGFRRAAAGRSWGAPIFPRMVPLEKPHGVVILEPWDEEYAAEPLAVDPARLEKGLAAVGAPFSRLWNRDGIWRPVARV
jgi:8-oxo-dGTP pyrophosphatase MutT (NUDIX family)